MIKPYFIFFLCLAVLLLSSLGFSPSSLAYRGGSGIPSCHDDIAAGKDTSGTGPECTPPILSKENSLEILKKLTARKIKDRWYIFITAEELAGSLDTAARWKAISLFVSAVLSAFGEEKNCYIARLPETEEEKEALLQGGYPQQFIAAQALPSSLSQEDKNSKKWPEYHHHSLYTITVY